MSNQNDFIVKYGLVVESTATISSANNLVTTNTVRPPAKPSLDLNFTRSNSLDSRISFSRSSVATYIDRDGYIKAAALNQPRFDYDPTTGQSRGLYIGEARTNLLTNSANPQNLYCATSNTFVISYDIPPLFAGAAVFKSTRDTSQSDNNVGYLGQTSVLSTSSVSVASVWVYIPSVTTITSITLSFEGSGLTAPFYQLDTLDTTKRNQWQRISSTCTSNTTTGIVSILRPTGMVTGGYFYSTCWQVETNLLSTAAYPSSYIPTNGSQVTRAADRCTMPSGPWYTPNQGTWFGEWQGGKDNTQGAYGRVVSPGGAYTILGNDTGTTTAIGSWGGGSGSLNLDTGIDYWTTIGKMATSYNLTTLARSISGRGKITSGAMQAFEAPNYIISNSTGFGIGQNAQAATNVINGRIRRITYWPTVLSSAQLQQLTS
jgi:hypothetical protein